VAEAGIEQVREHVAELREQFAALTALVRRDGHRKPGLDSVDEELADAVKVLAQAHEAERRQLTGDQIATLRRRVAAVQGQLAKSPSRRAGGEQYVNLTPKQVQPKWATVEAAQRMVEADLVKLEEAGLGGGPDRDQVTAAKARISVVSRQRLEDAMASGDALPTWLTIAVGSVPRPDPEPWVKAAHQVLVYRLEHGVSDSVLPLGSKPAADDAYGARRAGEYKKLAEELNKLHELGGKNEYKL
jgi:hypothetical protein